MGIIVVPNAVERKPNTLYYVDGEGNLCEAEMSHGRTKAKGKEIRERNKAKYKREECF